MAHAAETVVIEPLIPMALLDVGDVLDNRYWKFCSDDPLAEALTYEEFAYGPDAILPAGTTVRIEYLWGFGETVHTKPKDYVVTLPKAATVSRAVHVLLSEYYATVESEGGSGRFFFIEQVHEKDGEIVVEWGT